MNHPIYSIQPDWDISIRNLDASIWYHKLDSASTSFRSLKIDEENSLYLPDVAEDEFKTVSDKISYFSSRLGSGCYRNTFQSPTCHFDNVFTMERQPKFTVSAFDVNASGELGLAATTNCNCVLFETRTGLVRRTFSPLEADITKAKFFPSGIVAMTAGLDMQLKIWCCITATCVAVLKPGTGGSTISDCNLSSEPGGHSSAIVDFDFINLGRNVVSVDGYGSVRFWDVPTKSCYRCVKLNSSIYNVATSSAQVNSGLHVEETIECGVLNTANQTVQPSDLGTRVVAVGTELGVVIVDPLCSECAFKISTGSGITSLSFCKDISQSAMSSRSVSLDNSQDDAASSCSESNEPLSAYEDHSVISSTEFALASGSCNGRVDLWDLRKANAPIWSFGGNLKALKSPIEQVRLFRWPISPGLHSPLKIGLVSASKCGHVFAHNISSANISPAKSPSNTLQLCGIDCERAVGLGVIAMPQNKYPSSLHNSVAVWTASTTGRFFYYDRLAVDTAFVNPALEFHT